MIDGRKSFDQALRNGIKTYGNVIKISIEQDCYYTEVCLLSYLYLKENHKMIAKDLRKKREKSKRKSKHSMLIQKQ